MSAPAPRREHLRADPDALPDPRSFASSPSPLAGSLWRIALFAAAAVAALALSGVAVRAVAGRVRRAAPPDLISRLPPLAVEGEREAPEKRALTPEEMVELNRSWIGSETIAPRDAAVDRATGEEIAPFEGFAVDVETTPEGARVAVNGADVGTAPIVAAVRCAPGERVEVRAERGRARGRAVTACRKDALVRLRIALANGR
jgi:PEGA domain-containing protein